ALDKTFDFTYPGIALIGGDIIYQYGNQNLSITALEYGQWTPGGANTIINTAEFSSGSTIKAGPIKFHPGENVLYSNGTFFEDLDFDGTLLLANGSPSSAMTFYAAKVSSSTGDFTAMILNETDYDLSQEKDILANPTATSELSVTEFSENFKLLIVPNPNNGKFQIVLPEMKGTYSEVKIRNMSGELLYELKLGHDEGTIEIEDLGLSSGIYMVSVKINDIEYRSRVVITL
ncbi:MAG: T9SS type A sorting domain-containing protein, partial [Crocinitomicaceae bacterium]|nr:T9SS type A sorting domain-containing protein [Crocinitomicaceae bacterium]